MNIGPTPAWPEPPRECSLFIEPLVIAREVGEYCRQEGLRIPNHDDIKWNETGRWMIVGDINEPVLELEIVIQWEAPIYKPVHKLLPFIHIRQKDCSTEHILTGYVSENVVALDIKPVVCGELIEEIRELVEEVELSNLSQADHTD